MSADGHQMVLENVVRRHKPSYRSRAYRMIGAALMILVTFVAQPIAQSVPVLAHDNTSSVAVSNVDMWNCTWQYNNGNWVPVTVNAAMAGAPSPVAGETILDYPPGTTVDGRIYSFKNRIRGSVEAWNGGIAQTDAGAAGFRLNDGNYNYTGGLYIGQINVYYVQAPASNTNPTRNPYVEFFAVSRSSGASQGCARGNTSTARIQRVAVMTPSYGSWHTAEERAAWEACAGQDLTGPYLCRKNVDYQSTVHHEIGHALSMFHPRTTAIDETWAHCTANVEPRVLRGGVWRPSDQAAMCSRWSFTTAKRTLYHLHNYDKVQLEHALRDQF